jgi:site-specific DNA-methyltransferase (adenine-specific)
MKMESKIICGETINEMSKLPSKSIDMILCDLPYGTTQCKWDSVIPFDMLWKEYTRIIKDNGAIVLTASQPFTSNLVMSNPKLFRYSLVWEKSKSTGYLNSKKMPMRSHEDILVFYKNLPTYNPQMVDGDPYDKGKAHRPTDVYREQKGEIHVKNETGKRYPRSVQYFKTAESEGKVYHPTQKPISLMEWLVKTYSNEGDMVLDNTIGGGTTAIACIRTNRKYIGIDVSEEYINITNQRINEEINNLELNWTDA